MNNPLNLTYVPTVKWRGLSDPPNAGRFCAFISPQYCYRAATLQVRTDISRGIDTPAKLIASWAPRGSNPTDAYIADVERWSAIPRDKRISTEDLLPLFRAMTRQENGTDPYPDSVIEDGISMAEPNALVSHVTQNSRVYGGLTSGAGLAALITFELARLHIQLAGPEIPFLQLACSALLAQLFPRGVSSN